MDTKDLAFIAQNSGQHAAALVAASSGAGSLDAFDLLDQFVAVRKVIFEGALELCGTTKAAVEAAEAERAAARVQAGFPASGPQGGGRTTPASSGGRVKVRKALEGHPIPDWLEKQVEWLIGKGDIPDTDVVEVWDNRSYLPMFGGSRSEKAAWFTTVEKPAGAKYGVGIWPPKNR